MRSKLNSNVGILCVLINWRVIFIWMVEVEMKKLNNVCVVVGNEKERLGCDFDFFFCCFLMLKIFKF